MRRFARSFVAAPMMTLTILLVVPATAAEPPKDPAAWTIFIANDNCPDYTWGYTESQTRKAFADVVKGHLDEMNRTDAHPPAERDCYNAAVTQEVLCFVEHYPERKDELIRRIKEGRLYVSPYLCNSLWAFQGVEGALRTFYPARRLEREWGIKFESAHHIELPSLPWGHATLLAGCGIKHLSLPYYAFDSTFGALKTPPIFWHEGPDGSRVKVVMDRYACGKASYMQGANVLNKPDAVEREWLAHYAGLGEAYPLRAILASGTHGDISPRSGDQARGFAEKIIQYNARPGQHPKLINATFPQFWQAVDEQEKKSPWLPTVRGDFGHSWDVWPVSLAKYAAAMREGERRLLTIEALRSTAVREQSSNDFYPPRGEPAEEYLIMLSDHAWNGTDERNQRHNAELRRDWSDKADKMITMSHLFAYLNMGFQGRDDCLTLFNPLSIVRRSLVQIGADREKPEVVNRGEALATQYVQEDGRRVLCFVSPPTLCFGFHRLVLAENKMNEGTVRESPTLRASPNEMECPFYRLVVDPTTGGLKSLVHKASGTELAVPGKGRTLCQTVYHDGKEHTLADCKTEVVAVGPVLARLRIGGTMAGIKVTNFVTLYAELDQVDFDVRIEKPVTTVQNRLCQVFPLMRDDATLRIATTGAVIRAKTQPQGDLLPGADTRRFAVQEFFDVSNDAIGVTVAPWDAFVLRTDLDTLAMEALGNDQNYKEVTKDQNGETEFRFRYSLQARAKGYDGPSAVAFARGATTPLLPVFGRLTKPKTPWPLIAVDPRRAIATCLKPADDPKEGGVILRLWETAGKTGPLTIAVVGYKRAIQTDLLERDGKELEMGDRQITLDLRPHGFAAIRLLP
jgi:hypothetical protein